MQNSRTTNVVLVILMMLSVEQSSVSVVDYFLNLILFFNFFYCNHKSVLNWLGIPKTKRS